MVRYRFIASPRLTYLDESPTRACGSTIYGGFVFSSGYLVSLLVSATSCLYSFLLINIFTVSWRRVHVTCRMQKRNHAAPSEVSRSFPYLYIHTELVPATPQLALQLSWRDVRVLLSSYWFCDCEVIRNDTLIYLLRSTPHMVRN
jgi:hypothetical protein